MFRGTVDVDMDVTQNPGCDSYRVGLWEQLQESRGQPCLHDIISVKEVKINVTVCYRLCVLLVATVQ